MKKKLIQRLQEIIIEIVKADDKELNKLGLELIEIEKKLMSYEAKKTSKPKITL